MSEDVLRNWVSDFDGHTFVMAPDAPESWADGFRDALIHLRQQRAYVMDNASNVLLTEFGTPEHDAAILYADGYLCALGMYAEAFRLVAK